MALPVHIAARVFTALIVAAILAACGSADDRGVDSTATYDAHGIAFGPAAAIPAQAVVAESEEYVGRAVMVEGVLHESCPPESCWMMIDTGSGSIRIFIPVNGSEMPSFTAPNNVAGRRAVVHGSLSQAADTTGRTYDIHATGVMVEKVRS